jgi:SAM-dependent methyltransferase
MRCLPDGAASMLRGLRRACVRAMYAGRRVHCACCGGSFRRFRDFGRPIRRGVMCPVCGSLERHRLVWLYLSRHTKVLDRSLRLLHIAPEPAIHRRLSAQRNLHYVCADLDSDLAKVHLDLCRLPFDDGRFDVVLCNHVLEHVCDDAAALREIRRVLRPGGRACLQVPVDEGLARSVEDPGTYGPEDRLRAFGQADHVRRYGRDYADRIRAAGLRTEIIQMDLQRDRAQAAAFGLMPGERIYVGVRE